MNRLFEEQASPAMPAAELVKHFIRHTLGCACPEEVFRSIEVRRDVRLNSFITLDSAIIVGNHLLVYIAEAGSAECVEEHLPVLVNAGKAERDEKGLNRFRLVLVADDPAEVLKAAEKQFEDLRGEDEKVHLHVIGRDELHFATEDTEGTEKG